MKLLSYFSAPERARRARQRERFNLAAELREITVSRRYYDAREPRIVARVAELDAIDGGKLRPMPRTVSEWVAQDLQAGHASDAAGYFFPTAAPASRIIEDDAKPRFVGGGGRHAEALRAARANLTGKANPTDADVEAALARAEWRWGPTHAETARGGPAKPQNLPKAAP